VLWGWVNFVVAGLLVYYSNFHAHTLRAFGAVAVGALVSGLILAYAWGAKPAKSATKTREA
ncbi:MAG: hypothetical protein ACREHG_11305, partial [Candidatus Saccharimonadales bacterium]